MHGREAAGGPNYPRDDDPAEGQASERAISEGRLAFLDRAPPIRRAMNTSDCFLNWPGPKPPHLSQQPPT